MNFQETLQTHLTAIQNRDWSTFAQTVTQAATFSCILLNGKQIDNAREFLAFTQDWFADPDWQIGFTQLKTIETAHMSIAVLAVHYTDKDPTGAPYQLDYYLSLGFVYEDDAWRLVFDQNTLRKS